MRYLLKSLYAKVIELFIMNYKQSSPEVLRQLIRDGELVGHTSGMAEGYAHNMEKNVRQLLIHLRVGKSLDF
jgi:uncharacterized protein YcsI (UPF0317 family)